ncbi:MAG: phosphoglycerate dehydrogenase [Flavobacteriales bacterium]|nr:phosphoglycerate dehydrogenase [Flavobacteriales bacterium]MBK6944822.1 phosphoglycerate dehydrogenase [Flavobacteriales bacterium]MBK7241029.1 phosphoglycerate dehydrogenase [Flavobacteriales bacterium]MBK7295826.1 phosphoglycerate dehydrogenase [Flavobacteriales bacterium]MBK9534479.1 phosphoglycerate dehydrogenase [Flavobacteriales bacterium]
MRIAFLDTVHPILADRLTAAGHTCTHSDNAAQGEIERILDNTEGIVVRSKKVNADRIDHSPHLKFIGRVGAGLENIDTAHCLKKNILVLNSPEGNRDGVGESCVMLLLALMKSLVPANHAVREGHWPREALRGTDLRDKTIGIIGFGQMGSSFAEKLRGFGVRILGYDKYKSGFSKAGIEECGLEQVLRQSDVISLHLPLTDETHHYANKDFFLRLGKPIWLINTSRGPVVHTEALLDAIDHHRVLAAGLDVLEFEGAELDGLDPSLDPATQKRLIAHPNVLLTPHIAGVTHEGKFKLADVLASKILQHFPHGQN